MIRRLILIAVMMGVFSGWCVSVIAQETPSASPESAEEAEVAASTVLDSGDVSWMLVSSALVLMMTCPGLALFYGGLVRRKNIISVLMQCFFLMGLMSIVWALW